MINWKGYGKKRSFHNTGNIPEFPVGTERNHENSVRIIGETEIRNIFRIQAYDVTIKPTCSVNFISVFNSWPEELK
jgi:hypothetical protein